jgi:hypothetical protein
VKAPEIHSTNRVPVFHWTATGARAIERRKATRRIARPSSALVVLALTLVSALVAVALPLAALASNAGPGA